MRASRLRCFGGRTRGARDARIYLNTRVYIGFGQTHESCISREKGIWGPSDHSNDVWKRARALGLTEERARFKKYLG